MSDENKGPISAFSHTSILSNGNPTKQPQKSPLAWKLVLIVLLVIIIVSGLVYLYYPREAAKIAVVDSAPVVAEVVQPTPKPRTDPIFEIIESIAIPISWSKPSYGSIKDEEGVDIPGLFIVSAPLAKTELDILESLDSIDSALATQHNWVQTYSEIGPKKILVAYKKNSQKLYIGLENNILTVLLAELL